MKFHVDSSGNDANDGLTPCTAKQTGAAAIALLNDGDTLLAKKGSTFRQQWDITKDDITIATYGDYDAAAPVLDGSDIVTTGWAQPDAVNYPNVWSRSWTRTSTTTTGSEHLGYWEAGIRTIRRNSLALLQAGANGEWHTTNSTGQTSTVSIRAAADPNSDSILREITKRHYTINSHATTNTATPSNTKIVGPFELRRCVGHYNALPQGSGEAKRVLLRDGNIHHSVSQGDLTDVLFTEYSPQIAASAVAFYTGTSSGFAPVATRNFVLFPTGSARVKDSSAFYSHGATGKVDSLTMNQCAVKGAAFYNADALVATINAGYCEDTPDRVCNLGADENFISHLVVHESAVSPFSASNIVFFTGNTIPAKATVSQCLCQFKTGGGVNQVNGTHQHAYSHCSFSVSNKEVMTGGGPSVHYCILDGGRSYNFLTNTYIGDYNVFYFTGLAAPRFHWNGALYTDLPTFQAASGQDANSVYLKHADQVSGNGIAFWKGLADGTNLGPVDGDWRVNSAAKVYKGNGTSLTGLFADGVTPITQAGATEHWDWNHRLVVPGVPSRKPAFPATTDEMRAYIVEPHEWEFYP